MSTDELKAPRYCKACFYELRDHRSAVCPECGRPFDPDDPRTTSAHPVGSLPRKIAGVAGFLTYALLTVTLLCILGSAFSHDVILAFLVGLMMTPVVLILLSCIALPILPIPVRTRVIALATILLLASVLITGWPFRVNFKLHQSALEARAALVRSGELATPTGPVRVGGLFLKNIRQVEGNVGFQLSGGPGGGVFVVQLGASPRSAWFNTNWEIVLDDDWVWLYQD